MMLLPSLLLLLLLCCTALATPYGYQSGHDEGHSYAGGLFYDKNNHRLYLTGQTYGEYFLGSRVGIDEAPQESNCFLGVIELPHELDHELEWLGTRQVGNATVSEACSAMVVTGSDAIYAVGHSEEDGVLTGVRPFGSTRSFVYGTVAELDVSFGPDQKATMDLKGGRLVHPSKGVHYPVAVDIDPDSDAVFVGAMSSESSILSDKHPDGDRNRPDMTSGAYLKYGSDYSVSIERLQPWPTPPAADGSNVDLYETLSRGWGFYEAAEDENGEKKEVHLSSLEYINEHALLFAGSTKGFGPSFGANTRSSADDMDGFVTLLDASTGNPPTDRKWSIRIGSDQDDHVNGLCHFGNQVYVVGTTFGLLGDDDKTEGDTSGSDAFIMRLDLDTLDILWIHQIGAIKGPHTPQNAKPHVRGIGCAVTPDGKNVYLAGNVRSGGIITSEGIPGAYSLGGNDIFVAQLSVAGAINFGVQMGTSHNEYLARGGGITVDSDGNAIIMGNTNGAMIRNKDVESDQHMDVFFQSVDAENGDHFQSIERERGFHENMPTQPPAPTSPPGPTLTPVTVPSPQDNGDNGDNGGDNGGGVNGGVIFLVVAVSLVVCVGFYFAVKRVKRQRIKKQEENLSPFSDPVAPYTSRFNYGDVDVKHSATGGYHGMYTNPKLSSEGSMSSRAKSYHEELEEIKFNVGAPSSTFESSIVKNSLFMDDMDVPSLGSSSSNRRLEVGEDREGRPDMQKQLSTYDDLLDAYNTTWDDLNPHKLPSESSGLSMPGRGRKDAEETGLLDADEGWGQEII